VGKNSNFGNPPSGEVDKRERWHKRLIIRREGSFNVIRDYFVRKGRWILRYYPLNRPKSLNALKIQLWADLDSALDEIDKDPDIKAFIFTGAPRPDGRP
jgi:1,4-dihydroxy-2-naphthoyl-CoA synthase